jgi:hypothetical protein
VNVTLGHAETIPQTVGTKTVSDSLVRVAAIKPPNDDWRSLEMATVQHFSKRVIDYAERLSGMADAAEGKRAPQSGRATRWIVLPASGAALYALVKSEFFSRQARDVVKDAKARAAEMPDDLVSRVRETVGSSDRGNGSRSSSRQTQGQARQTAKRKAKATS